MNENIKVSDDLRKELRTIKESTTDFKKKSQPQRIQANRPMTSNPYSQKSNQNTNIENRNHYIQVK